MLLVNGGIERAISRCNPSGLIAVFTFSHCSDLLQSDARRLAANIDKRTCDTSRAIFVSYPQLNGVTQAVKDFKQPLD
jgi:hypothetical protein